MITQPLHLFTANIAHANAAYLRIVGTSAPLTRLPREEGTHAWVDPQGRRLVTLWGANQQRVGWRFDGVTHWDTTPDTTTTHRPNTYHFQGLRCLCNGSFHRKTTRKGEYACYMNGDFIAFTQQLPADCIHHMTRLEAKPHLPACNV